MNRKGQRKYACRDCGETRMVHWVERNRAAPPRCLRCGGIVEPYSDGALEQERIGELNLRDYDPSRGDLKPSSAGRRTKDLL